MPYLGGTILRRFGSACRSQQSSRANTDEYTGISISEGAFVATVGSHLEGGGVWRTPQPVFVWAPASRLYVAGAGACVGTQVNTSNNTGGLRQQCKALRHFLAASWHSCRPQQPLTTAPKCSVQRPQLQKGKLQEGGSCSVANKAPSPTWHKKCCYPWPSRLFVCIRCSAHTFAGMLVCWLLLR